MQHSYYSIFDRHWDGVIVLDNKSQVVYCNESLAELARIPLAQIRVGSRLNDHFFFAPELFENISDISSPTQIIQVHFVTQSGYAGDFQTVIQPCPLSSEAEPNWILFFKDLSLENQLFDKYHMARERGRKLREKNQIDPLTGAYNRGHFDWELERAFNQANNWKFNLSLILFDIDDFKKINDVHGHQAGDFILKALVSHLSEKVLRQGSPLFRYGGEEFAILLTREPISNALKVAERVRQSIEQLNPVYKDVTLGFTLSLGVAEFDSTMVEPKDLIQKADEAAYQSKKNGKNRVTAAT